MTLSPAKIPGKHHVLFFGGLLDRPCAENASEHLLKKHMKPSSNEVYYRIFMYLGFCHVNIKHTYSTDNLNILVADKNGVLPAMDRAN